MVDPQGTNTPGPVEAHLLAHLLSSLIPMTIQLWGPTLQFARGVPVTEHRREYSSYFIWKINVWFSISVEQTSNVEFVTGVQLLDSGMCSWISSLSGSFTSIGFYRVFSRFPVLYSRSILMLQFSVLRNSICKLQLLSYPFLLLYPFSNTKWLF